MLSDGNISESKNLTTQRRKKALSEKAKRKSICVGKSNFSLGLCLIKPYMFRYGLLKLKIGNKIRFKVAKRNNPFELDRKNLKEKTIINVIELCN